jgi:hypothetical protein
MRRFDRDNGEFTLEAGSFNGRFASICVSGGNATLRLYDNGKVVKKIDGEYARPITDRALAWVA